MCKLKGLAPLTLVVDSFTQRNEKVGGFSFSSLAFQRSLWGFNENENVSPWKILSCLLAFDLIELKLD